MDAQATRDTVTARLRRATRASLGACFATASSRRTSSPLRTGGKATQFTGTRAHSGVVKAHPTAAASSTAPASPARAASALHKREA